MRLHHAALFTLLITPVPAMAQENLGTYEDRIAVEDVMARYVWAVDSLDPDGYVAVFTDDATINSNGSISKGHEEIRKIVTGLIRRRDDNKAKGLPTANLYHVISSVRITFPKPGEAVHQSVLADRASRQGRQDDRGRDGPLRRPARRAQRQVVDSVAEADGFHRLTVELRASTARRGDPCPCRNAETSSSISRPARTATSRAPTAISSG